MAKKKQDLSPEERLAAALVPEEEWPYALPDGWKWVYLSGILDVSKEKTDDFPPDTKYVGLENIEKDTGRIQAASAEGIRSTKNIFEPGNILYGKLRPYLNKHTVAKFAGVCSTDILVLQAAPSIEKGLLNRYFDLPQFISFAMSHSKGINLPRVSAKEILTARMPLPPLSEQHRLVARIESLFAKLDAAKQQAQSVLDSHEPRKAALLHAAFAGKLTAKWREEHKFSYNEWHLVCIKDICHSLKYGTAKKSEASGRYVVIRMGNLFDGEILWDNLAYSNDNEDIEKYQLTPGDVLFNRTNSAALVGKTSIYRGDYPAIYAGYIIKLDYDRKTIDGEFLNYIMNSPCAKTYCNKVKTDGVNQSNINAKKIGAFQFKRPSLPEQQEIVRILDRLLAREQRARQAAEKTLAAIDRMKQAILARAFRGEL